MKDIAHAIGPHHERTFANSRAFRFLVCEYAEHIKRGFGDDEMSFCNESHVCYMMEGDTCIAAITWMYDPTRSAAWTLFSAVREDWRKHGLYTKMYQSVIGKAKQAGAIAIYSGVSVDNESMLSAYAKLGRTPMWYRTKRSLRP